MGVTFLCGGKKRKKNLEIAVMEFSVSYLFFLQPSVI